MREGGRTKFFLPLDGGGKFLYISKAFEVTIFDNRLSVPEMSLISGLRRTLQNQALFESLILAQNQRWRRA